MVPYYHHWNSSLAKKIELLHQNIHIWEVSISEFSKTVEVFYTLLSQDEVLQAKHYKLEHDRKHFIIIRGILREIISRYLVINAEAIQFCYNAYGNPFLKDPIQENTINFNFTHSGDLALYIFSRKNRLGIDLEKIYPLDNYETIVEHFFSPQEIICLKSVPVPYQLSFFQVLDAQRGFYQGNW